MQNPYESLFERPREKPIANYEEVGGAMDCQVCYEVVTEGRYYVADRLLEWTCSKGHKSKAEGVSI